ncbi:MAG TPA: endolytic transglycosylase MltG [Desulfuromonadaceae bacterium]|jgi:UPF0755 protein
MSWGKLATIAIDVKVRPRALTKDYFISIMVAMSLFKPTPKTSLILLLRIFLLSVLSWYFVCLFIPPGHGAVIQDVSFPSGSGIKKLANELECSGIIRSSWHFILMARLRGEARRLKAGDYRLNDSMTPRQILNKIVAGDVDYRRFALPEGYSIYQVAELLEQKGYFKKGVFLEKCRDKELLRRFAIQGGSVEGYLFPATYNLSRGGNEEQLIDQMVGQFFKNYSGLKAGSHPRFSSHQIVTLASVIEKEAVSPEEKPLIASVFYNRLRIGMPLQSDPTAVYGVRAFSGRVTKSDIERRSPYNTYLNPGLPPGPIGNPGLDAIRAVLSPARTDYFYFVARKDGTHQFSRTLTDHNRAVVRYLRNNL